MLAERLVRSLELVIEIDREQEKSLEEAKRFAAAAESRFDRLVQARRARQSADSSEVQSPPAEHPELRGNWRQRQREGAGLSVRRQDAQCEVDSLCLKLWTSPELRPDLEALAGTMRALRMLAVEGTVEDLPLIQQELKPAEAFLEERKGTLGCVADPAAAEMRRIEYAAGFMERMREVHRAEAARMDVRLAREKQLLQEALQIARSIRQAADQ